MVVPGYCCLLPLRRIISQLYNYSLKRTSDLVFLVREAKRLCSIIRRKDPPLLTPISPDSDSSLSARSRRRDRQFAMRRELTAHPLVLISSNIFRAFRWPGAFHRAPKPPGLDPHGKRSSRRAEQQPRALLNAATAFPYIFPPGHHRCHMMFAPRDRTAK